MKVVDIKEGETIELYSQFNGPIVMNRITKLSDDYSGLNRDIGYFQYTDRQMAYATKEQFIKDMKNNVYRIGVMAIWQWGLDSSEKLKSLYEKKQLSF